MPRRHPAAHILSSPYQVASWFLFHARHRDRDDLAEVQQPRRCRRLAVDTFTGQDRAGPDPVEPASYVTATGPGSDRSHLSSSPWSGANRARTAPRSPRPARRPPPIVRAADAAECFSRDASLG
jgi:hypothetical protein